jgi:hypothetical protein
LLKGFETAFQGRVLAGLPAELTAAIRQAGGGSLALRLRGGDPDAVAKALEMIANPQADRAERVQFIQVLGQIQQPACVPVLLQIATGSGSDIEVRSAAVSALQSYDDPRIPDELVRSASELPEPIRETALSVLASRRAWAMKLVASVAAGSIPCCSCANRNWSTGFSSYGAMSMTRRPKKCAGKSKRCSRQLQVVRETRTGGSGCSIRTAPNATFYSVPAARSVPILPCTNETTRQSQPGDPRGF